MINNATFTTVKSVSDISISRPTYAIRDIAPSDNAIIEESEIRDKLQCYSRRAFPFNHYTMGVDELRMVSLECLSYESISITELYCGCWNNRGTIRMYQQLLRDKLN